MVTIDDVLTGGPVGKPEREEGRVCFDWSLRRVATP